jgi:hypothetical protein
MLNREQIAEMREWCGNIICDQAEAAIDLRDALDKSVMCHEVGVQPGKTAFEQMKAALAKAQAIAPDGADMKDINRHSWEGWNSSSGKD